LDEERPFLGHPGDLARGSLRHHHSEAYGGLELGCLENVLVLEALAEAAWG